MSNQVKVYEGHVIPWMAPSGEPENQGALVIPFHEFHGKNVRVTVEVLGE